MSARPKDAPGCCGFVTARVLTSGEPRHSVHLPGFWSRLAGLEVGKLWNLWHATETKVRRRLLTATVLLTTCAVGGLAIARALALRATSAARPLPAAAVALGRIQAPFPTEVPGRP